METHASIPPQGWGGPINTNIIGKLSSSQREAVECAIGRGVALLEGPPGTGKTTTAVEIVRYSIQTNTLRTRGSMRVVLWPLRGGCRRREP